MSTSIRTRTRTRNDFKTESKWVESAVKSLKTSQGEYIQSISGNAKKNAAETFADAFAEYHCSENPRRECSGTIQQMDRRQKNMILLNLPCDNCTHRRPNKNGWKSACDAFPNGIPRENLFYKKVAELKECNNSIGYEPREDRPDIQ